VRESPATDPWPADIRRTTVRDLLALVVLTGVPLAVAAMAARSDRDLVVKSIVVGASLFVPTFIVLAWLVCRLARPGEPHMPDWFVVVYTALTFLSVFAIVVVFMFDMPMAGLLGLGLFGLMAYLSSWI
jgi:hypothetical protein